MAAPVIVACPDGQWTRVLQNVTAGKVHIKTLMTSDGTKVKYYQTYRDTGGAAPAGMSEAVPMIIMSSPVQAAAPVDVYVMARGGIGSVRADL